MLPHIHLGPFVLPSYSLLAFFGLIALTVTSILIFERKAGKHSAVTNRVLLVTAVGFVFLVLSAAFFNSLFHSIAEGRLVTGGITWLGGVVGGFPFTVFLLARLCPHVRGEALETFSLLIPGITLGHALGRIGCFLGGCCYGGVTRGPLGVSFPTGSPAAYDYPAPDGGSLPVLPTQLIEAVFELLLFVAMLLLYRRLSRYFLSVYCLGYGTFRFIIEFWRGDDRGATGFFLTPSQLLGVVLVIVGILLLLYQHGVIFKALKAKNDEKKELRLCEGIPHSIREERALCALSRLKKEGVLTEEEYAEKRKHFLHPETRASS